ncbi:MAG: PIN domain-containing protein [bacterium]
MALFDTDVLIDHLRGKKGAQETLLQFIHEDNYCSVITSGEILFGMREDEKEETFALLNCFKEVPVDKNIIRLSYEIKVNAKGHQLQLYDCIISATSIMLNQLLITWNAKHYPDSRVRVFIPKY